MTVRCFQVSERYDEQGFSLLEILVALAIIGFSVSIAVTNVNTMMRQAEQKKLKSVVDLVLRDAKFEAALKRREVVFQDYFSEYVNANDIGNENWNLKTPIRISKLSLCSQGEIEVKQGNKFEYLKIVSAECETELAY